MNAEYLPTAQFVSFAALASEAYNWVYLPMEKLQYGVPMLAVAIVACHWVPIVLQRHQSVIRVHTTHDAHSLIDHLQHMANTMGMTLWQIKLKCHIASMLIAVFRFSHGCMLT